VGPAPAQEFEGRGLMPENAAAEGGYGLSASEAFGGQVGTGNVSPSAVGGTFGGFGPSFGGGGDDPAQAGRYGPMGTPNANATFASVQALADRGRSIALANMLANNAARGMFQKSQSEMGVGNVVAAHQAVNATINAFGSITPHGINQISQETGVPAEQVGQIAQSALGQMQSKAIGTQVDVDAALNRGGVQGGNFGPGLLGGTVSSADLASGNMSTTGIPGASGSVSTNAAGSISPAEASGIVSALSAPVSMTNPNTGAQMTIGLNTRSGRNDYGDLGVGQMPGAVTAADLAAGRSISTPTGRGGYVTTAPSVADAFDFGVPSGLLGSIPSAAPASQGPMSVDIPAPAAQPAMSPATVAQAMTQPAAQPAAAQTVTPYSERGLLGRLGMDLAMGFTQPFASREDRAQTMLSRGYSQADIDDFFARTDATIARNAERDQMFGGGPGPRFVTDVALMEYGQSLPPEKRQMFMAADRATQVSMYNQAMGY